MNKPLAEPMKAKLVHIPERQYVILDLIKRHGGGSHSEIIRRALDAELKGWIFPLKDCAGVDVEKELKERGLN